jgi:xanthine dehydrogenase/oxidase
VKTVQYLTGKTWGSDLLDPVYKLILEDLPLPATAPGGQIEFRKLLGTLE